MARGRASVEAIEEATGETAGSALRSADPEQEVLFAELVAEERADFERQFPIAAAIRGPGRPKGSRNRATKDTLRLLQAHGTTDPLLFLARIVTMTPNELRASYSVDGAQALSAQLRAAADLAPYIHAKQARTLDLKGAQGAPVFIRIGQGWETAPPDIQGGRTIEGSSAEEYETAAPDISSGYDEASDQVTSPDSHHEPENDAETDA